MAMNFFEHQDAARKKTGRLVVMFILAMIGIIIGVYLVVAGAIVFIGGYSGGSVGGEALLNPILLGAVAGATILIVGSSSLIKIASLGGGGSVIAESLSGRRLAADTHDLTERRVLNVVEELAIASGVPVPPVYMMDQEAGVNAFAAGYSPGDAVIGVTRGCAERLSRDELQGVIAHEFSHILNGDMRLNIRLIGLLHGILVIGLVGYFILRSVFHGGSYGRRSSRSKGEGGWILAILAIGAGLVAVGSIGTFFGTWIKSAVSRQREFLADASAVQFTRNPDGIAGALRKIGGFRTGSKVHNPNAPQASHMFFGQAVTSGFNALFATHPPLDERIRRIDPGWDGRFAESTAPTREMGPTAAAAAPQLAIERARAQARAHAASRAHAAAPAAMGLAAGAAAAAAVATIGQPTPAHVEYARDLLASLPESLREAAHETFGARAAVYALLVGRDDDVQRAQLGLLERDAEEGVFAVVRSILPDIAQLGVEFRLPLLDAAMPALRAMSPKQYERFRANVIQLIRADERLELFEWCLQRILLQHLDAHYRGRGARPRRIHHYGLQRLEGPLARVLSTLAYVGAADGDAAQRAFEAGAGQLGIAGLDLLAPAELRFDGLDAALDELDRIKPQLKRTVILACAATIASDREVKAEEVELFRAIGETLGCPVPPMLAGERNRQA